MPWRVPFSALQLFFPQCVLPPTCVGFTWQRFGLHFLTVPTGQVQGWLPAGVSSGYCMHFLPQVTGVSCKGLGQFIKQHCCRTNSQQLFQDVLNTVLHGQVVTRSYLGVSEDVKPVGRSRTSSSAICRPFWTLFLELTAFQTKAESCSERASWCCPKGSPEIELLSTGRIGDPTCFICGRLPIPFCIQHYRQTLVRAKSETNYTALSG